MEKVKIYLAMLIPTIWVIVAVIGIYTKDHTALSLMTPVVLIIIGFLFGRKLINGENNGENK